MRLCCRLIHASFTGQSTSYTQFSRCSCIHSFISLCVFLVIQPFNHSVSQLLSDSSTVHLFFHSILTHTHAGHIRSSILPNTLHGACGSKAKGKHVWCHLYLRQKGIADFVFTSLGWFQVTFRKSAILLIYIFEQIWGKKTGILKTWYYTGIPPVITLRNNTVYHR